jgi:hypothetical protein
MCEGSRLEPVMDQKTPNTKNNLLVKVAVTCVFLAVAIIWQQYYFRAIDDVDGRGTTLWNWPAFVLIVFGIAALIVRIFRFTARRRDKKSDSDR